MQGDAIQRVAIIGAGLMGHGIAQEYALAGYAVCIHDVSEERLAQATARMGDNLRMLAGLGLATPEQAETVPERIQKACPRLTLAKLNKSDGNNAGLLLPKSPPG